jgi:hypothetical protein
MTDHHWNQSRAAQEDSLPLVLRLGLEWKVNVSPPANCSSSGVSRCGRPAWAASNIVVAGPHLEATGQPAHPPDLGPADAPPHPVQLRPQRAQDPPSPRPVDPASPLHAAGSRRSQHHGNSTGLPPAADAQIPSAGSATTGSTYRLRNLFSQPLQLLLGPGTTGNRDHPIAHLRHPQTRNFQHDAQ